MSTTTSTITTTQSKLYLKNGHWRQFTKLIVTHRRPVLITSLNSSEFVDERTINNESEAKGKLLLLPNAKCIFARHPLSSPSACDQHKQQTTCPVMKHKSSLTSLKRSLSADDLESLPAVSTGPLSSIQQEQQRPIMLFNRYYARNYRPSRKAVATAYWQDGSFEDAMTEETFVCIKLLEASQARRCIQLQGKPRKNLHLAGGEFEKEDVLSTSTPLIPRQNPHYNTPSTVCEKPMDKKKTLRPLLPAPSDVVPPSKIHNRMPVRVRPPPLRFASFPFVKTAPDVHTAATSNFKCISSLSHDMPQDLSSGRRSNVSESRLATWGNTIRKQLAFD